MQTYASADTHTCKNLCGFRGNYDQVLRHEQSCSAVSTPVAPVGRSHTQSEPAAAASGEGQQARAADITYTCAFHCGFRGTFDAVALHEVKCVKNPESLRSGASNARVCAREAVSETEGGATDNGVGTYVDDRFQYNLG